jgi:hypothetical protein
MTQCWDVGRDAEGIPSFVSWRTPIPRTLGVIRVPLVIPEGLNLQKKVCIHKSFPSVCDSVLHAFRMINVLLDEKKAG